MTPVLTCTTCTTTVSEDEVISDETGNYCEPCIVKMIEEIRSNLASDVILP